MGDVLEAAKSNRSSCRACWKRIDKGELRFGASEESFYGDGSASYAWFHPRCAAQRMPERARAVFVAVGPAPLPDFDALLAACEKAQNKSASKFPYGERAPSSRSRCMRCRETIAKGELRVAIEREIDAGGFATTGAGYLHPRCAARHLQEPELAARLTESSPLLSMADRDELVKLVEDSGASMGSGARPARVAQKVAKPKADASEDLVFADALIEKGDPRGELIVVATELDTPDLDEARAATLSARAMELAPAAQEAWADELGLSPSDFFLEGGLPSGVQVELGPKSKLPQHPWIRGYSVEGASGAELARLLASTELARVRHLVLEDTKVSWDGFRELVTSPALEHLRSLDLFINVGARGLHMLFTSRQLESLEHLTVSMNSQATPDLRGFESVAGLPALRSLHIASGANAHLTGALVQSPLVHRLEELTFDGWAFPWDFPGLPNLRRLRIVGGSLHLAPAQSLIRVANQLPRLTRVDLSATKTDDLTLKRLRKAFGDRLIAHASKPTRAAKKKSAAPKKKKKKKKKASRRA